MINYVVESAFLFYFTLCPRNIFCGLPFMRPIFYNPLILLLSLRPLTQVLKFCKQKLTGSCKPITWTKYSDMSVHGGGRRDSSSTLALCQDRCVKTNNCTGVDYWSAAAYTKCWLHGSWSAGNPLRSKPGVDHHKLTRNPNCDGKWHAFIDLVNAVIHRKHDRFIFRIIFVKCGVVCWFYRASA